MTFETFIPARSKAVLELTGDAPKDFETSREKFLEIQPDCRYTVAAEVDGVKGSFDAILIQSPLIGTLTQKNLVALMKKIAERLKPRGTLIFTLDNIGNADNLVALLEGKPPKFKVTLTRDELKDAIEAAGLNVLRSLNAGRGTQVKRQLAELAKTLNAMLDRLQAPIQSQQKFVSYASHELRTPATVFLGYVDVLEKYGKDDPDLLKESIDAIRSEANNLQSLLERI